MRGAGVFYSSPAYLEEPIMSRDCDFAGLSGGVPVDCHANNNLRWAKWRWVMLLAANHVPSSTSASPSLLFPCAPFLHATELSTSKERCVFDSVWLNAQNIAMPCSAHRDTMTSRARR